MINRRWILGAGVSTVASATLSVKLKADDSPRKEIVFLTSDDGPGAGTETIIDIAERYDVPIALFLIGENAVASAEHEKLLQRAHGSKWITVGNHSESHCLSHYVHCYRDTKSIISDFERSNNDLGLVSRPIPARGPGRNVWRLPGMHVDDPAISATEMRGEDNADDTLFANGFYLYGWDIEWLHDARGIPVQTSETMVDQLTRRAPNIRPGKVVMLMHDVMMKTANAASELIRIIEGVRSRGSRFGRLSEY